MQRFILRSETKFAERFNVQVFPTPNFFVNGEAIDFNCRPKTKNIVCLIKKCVQEVSAIISDQSVFESFIKDIQIGVVYFRNYKNNAHLSAFKFIALNQEKFVFEHIFKDEVVANKKNTFGSVVIFKKFDEGCND